MTNEEKASIWWDGYFAGAEDNDSCKHKLGYTSRILWKLSRGRWIAPWDKGDCKLYTTQCPYEKQIEDVDIDTWEQEGGNCA